MPWSCATFSSRVIRATRSATRSSIGRAESLYDGVDWAMSATEIRIGSAAPARHATIFVSIAAERARRGLPSGLRLLDSAASLEYEPIGHDSTSHRAAGVDGDHSRWRHNVTGHRNAVHRDPSRGYVDRQP